MAFLMAHLPRDRMMPPPMSPSARRGRRRQQPGPFLREGGETAGSSSSSNNNNNNNKQQHVILRRVASATGVGMMLRAMVLTPTRQLDNNLAGQLRWQPIAAANLRRQLSFYRARAVARIAARHNAKPSRCVIAATPSTNSSRRPCDSIYAITKNRPYTEEEKVRATGRKIDGIDLMVRSGNKPWSSKHFVNC